MKDKYKGRENFIIIILVITFLALAILFSILGVLIKYQGNSAINHKEAQKIVHIRDNIRVKSSNGNETIVNLPKKFDDNFTYSYNFVPTLLAPGEKLFMYIKGSYHVFTLSYQDEVIYKSALDTSFVKGAGDYIRVVLIPNKYIGKELTISFESLKHSSYGILVPPVKLGNHSDLIYSSYENDFDVIIVAAFLLVFSIESFIIQIGLLFYKKAHISSLLGPLYALIVGLYIIIRSPAIFFFISKGAFIYFFDYILFLLLPLSVAMFMISVARQKCNRKRLHKIIEAVLAIFVLYFIAQMLLTLFGFIEFMEYQKVSQIIVVVVALISVFIPFTIEDFAFKRIISFLMAGLMVVLVILLAVYVSTYRLRYLTILGVFGGIFILFQSLVTMKLYAKNYNISYRAVLNKQMAYTDNLTRLLNRNAFEDDIKAIEASGQKMMLMIIDINSLKKINDQFGHNTGDQILKNIAEILDKIRIKFNKTNTYRIGGDEFVITAFNVDESYAKKIADYLNNQAKERDYIAQLNQFSFGIGYKVTLVDSTFEIDAFMREVDIKMYEDKKQKKRNFSNEEPKMLVIEQ